MKELDLLVEKIRKKVPAEDHEYWFALEREANEFYNNPNISEEDKRKLRFGWGESLYMICRGIEWMEKQK